MSISVQGISWSVAHKRILQLVSLEVEQGETLGLIGANGSGKSSLLKVMAGLIKADSGTILIQGQPIKQLSKKQLAQRLAFVEQSAFTQEQISVRDVVELGRIPWQSSFSFFPTETGDSQGVEDALKATRIQHLAERQWHTLSGGERQRVHIARAIAQQPQILLLDEPANHLDIYHQLLIMDLVHQLNTTTVIAIHDLNQAMSCDRLLLLHQGQVVALGSPSEVLTADHLRACLAVNSHLLTDPIDQSKILRFSLPVT